MSDTGDRLVSAAFVTDPALIRPWSMDLDRLPNQGQLDTSVPAHAVDLDAIRRAGIPRHIDDWLEDRYAHPRPRVVRHRRTTRLGTVALWCWRKRGDAALLLLVLLAIAGAVAVMNALLPGEAWK